MYSFRMNFGRLMPCEKIIIKTFLVLTIVSHKPLKRASTYCNMSGFKNTVDLNNGKKMPVIGLGTWKSKPGEVKNAVKAAIEAGYRHIDCAYVYGNEPEIGEALKEIFAAGIVKREDLFITSKLWNTRHLPGDVKPSIQESLSSLGLDYLDLYLIHWPHSFKPGKDNFPKEENGQLIFVDIPPLDTWKAMEKLVDEGLAKSIGLSNFNSVQVQYLIDSARIKPAVNQVEIHPYANNDKLVKFCQSRGVVMTAYSPFASPDRPWASPSEPVLLDDPELKKLGDKYGKTSAQVVLRWLLQKDIIVIPKSVTPSRIQQNLNVSDFKLSAEDMEVINDFNKNMKLLVPMAEEDGKRVYRDRKAPNFPFNIEF